MRFNPQWQRQRKRSKGELLLLNRIILADLLRPEEEYLFCEGRRWRFDFAWTYKKVAVEIEGGVWIQGRHNRGKGFINDCEKYNTATLLGWRVLRYTPQMLDVAISDLQKILK